MKTHTIILLLLIGLHLYSCSNDDIALGTVKYHSDFLWVDSNIVPIEKVFDFEFSQDAKNDKKSFAEFQFVDNEGVAIPTDVLAITVDGEKLKNNRLRISSNEHSKKIVFSFSPEAKAGKYQGYLALVNHNLDRVDNKVLTKGDIVNVFQWTLHFEKCLNPLAKFLIWLSLTIVSLLIIWFSILRPIIFPKFGTFRKSVLVQRNGIMVGQLNVNFKGAKKIVFSNNVIKQSKWNRLFTGEIRTVKNQEFEFPLTFVPHRNNAVVHGIGYTIKPNPIPRSGTATISNSKNNLIIIIR